MANRTLVIVNPSSRNGRTGSRWPEIEKRLRDELGPLEIERTRAPRDAERIAREGVRAGVERLIVAGGDGTLSEVVTGLLEADLAGYAQIAPLPLGTGGDFTRTLGLRGEIGDAIRALATAKPRPIDAGRVHYRDAAGRDATSCFLNVVSLGVSGEIVQLVNSSSKALGGTLSFLAGTLRGLARFRSQPVTLRVDGEVVHDGPLNLAAVANGRYFGGGMNVAPDAELDDGQLDVVVVGAAPKWKLLTRLPRIYRGTHIAENAASLHRGALVEAQTNGSAVWIEVDGEPLGTLPVRIEILPAAIQLLAP